MSTRRKIDLPSVPPGAVEISNDMGCGSGGCWKELRLRPAPGTRPEDLVATLGLDHTQCRRDNWPDPRATCVGATVHSDGVVLVFAQYHW